MLDASPDLLVARNSDGILDGPSDRRSAATNPSGRGGGETPPKRNGYKSNQTSEAREGKDPVDRDPPVPQPLARITERNPLVPE